MSKKFKVIISVLMAVLMLTASGAAVAMAQDEPEAVPQLESRGGLLARVADILGITQAQLVGASKQARQEMREECQATGNCSVCREKVNRFRQRWTEKQQKWVEKRQEWMEKEQEIGKRFRCKGAENQQNSRLRISQSVRGRQMMAVPEGWNGQIPPQQVD